MGGVISYLYVKTNCTFDANDIMVGIKNGRRLYSADVHYSGCWLLGAKPDDNHLVWLEKIELMNTCNGMWRLESIFRVMINSLSLMFVKITV